MVDVEEVVVSDVDVVVVVDSVVVDWVVVVVGLVLQRPMIEQGVIQSELKYARGL